MAKALLSLSSDTAPKITINDRDALGIGSYGKVVRAKIGKQHCAAKLLHDTMFLFNDPGLQNFVRKFGEECRLLSRIDHPNIVKYLGTTSDPKTGRTALLMELMHESLTKFLERSPESGPGPLPYYPQFSIGHDVALALDYLHSRSIVHRDLSSNNVLLTADGAAKVTDFGMSRLIEMTPKATPLTQCPGTLAYMPPEALLTPPQYSDKFDCFSFGVLTVQIATRKFPDPGNANKYVEDPKYPSGRVIVQIPEVERRRKHIDLVEPDHPLLPLVIKCLSDRDTERPSAHEICETLAPLKAQELAKKEDEVKEQQLKREREQKERQRRKELEEQARKEKIRRRKEEKQKEREARRAAKAAARAEAAGQGLSDSTKLSVRLFIPSSKKKPRRFREDGFDLDLTYIKPNIIAMAFPCEKVESWFRNNIADVIRFLDLKYPDHYKVYNICSERSYDPGKFHQRVATYPFDEDNTPPFELIKPFCDDMDIWLKKDDRNVAVVHCDDGLGRTGVMITSYLLHDRLFDTALDALQYFGEARTQTAKGVTMPSQRRYVQYYGHLVRNQLEYIPTTVLLKGIRLEGVPHFGSGGCSLRFAVYLYKTKQFVSKVFETNRRTTDKFVDFSLDQPVPLCGDIKIAFFNKSTRIFRFWFNTFFVDMHRLQGLKSSTDPDTRIIALPKAELDKANKDTKHYPPFFEVRVMIKVLDDDCIISSALDDYEEDDISSALSKYEEDDEEDLSDTDPEDEWESQAI